MSWQSKVRTFDVDDEAFGMGVERLITNKAPRQDESRCVGEVLSWQLVERGCGTTRTVQGSRDNQKQG